MSASPATIIISYEDCIRLGVRACHIRMVADWHFDRSRSARTVAERGRHDAIGGHLVGLVQRLK